MRLIVKLEIFAEFPTPALLLATGGRVVRQVCVGIVIKETGHGDLYLADEMPPTQCNVKCLGSVLHGWILCLGFPASVGSLTVRDL
jgi:hypothetical protein